MNKFYVAFFFIVHIGCSVAQNNTGFFGRVVDSKTQNSLGFVVVSIQNTTLMQLTKDDGNFSFDTVPAGNILLLVHSQGDRKSVV